MAMIEPNYYDLTTNLVLSYHHTWRREKDWEQSKSAKECDLDEWFNPYWVFINFFFQELCEGNMSLV